MRVKLREILLLLRDEFNQRQELITNISKELSKDPSIKETIIELRRKNNGNLELQTNINKYFNEYLNTSIDSDGKLSYHDCLELTINGIIEYNFKNPFFFDIDFHNDLLKYYIEIEDYEKCGLIKRLWNNSF
jgi:hypothetical protein